MHYGRRKEIIAECIGAGGIDNIHRVRIILKTFTHFLSIFSKDEAIHNDVLKWSFSKKSYGEYQHIIKPPARLIESFGYKICRKILLKFFFVLKWIMKLRVRH